ncbi:MAG: GAF domain-containing protein [Comamonadaceae bacterium]|nr:MAG: GAF domain-containing protein [Comamonadaceae bacterium]
MKDEEVPGAASARDPEQLSGELIDLLHQGASADELAIRLAQVEQWPDRAVGKEKLVERIRMTMTLRNRLELFQQRESGMLAVIDSARDLSARLDLKELLRAVVTRARNILGSHVSWLTAYDGRLDLFEVLAVDGTHKLGPGQTVPGRDTGIVGLVKATRRPFTTQDYLHDTRFTHHASVDTTFRDEGVNAIVGVPLLWEDEVIGLLFVGDRHHRTHSAHDITILSTLSTHAAVAIKNARAFEEASAALQSAQAAHIALEQHARRMQAAAEAHERMTSLLAKGATLSTICQTIAEMFEADVLVLDEAAQPIGRGAAAHGAGADAQACAPHGVHSAELAHAMRQSRKIGRSVVAYESDGETCRLNAVIGGDVVLGSFLLFRTGALDEIEARTFERCTSVIGVLLLSRERMEVSKSREQAALLRSLLSPRPKEAPLLSQQAERFGLPLGQPLSLLVLEAEDPEAAYATRRLRAANLLPSVVFDDVDGAIVMLGATRQIEEVRAVVEEFMAKQLGGHWRGVLSRPAGTLVELPALHAMLRRALPVLRRIGVSNQIVGQNEMALYATLFETHDQSSLVAFLNSTIGPLATYDMKRGTQLRNTLLAYFDTNQSATLAAKRLAIHVNTARQRLATIEELLGSWAQATRALELHMALRLWHLSAGPPELDEGNAPHTPP